MFRIAVRSTVLFVVLACAAPACLAQVHGYLTVQEEAACKKDFNIRATVDDSDLSLRAFGWNCSQAMLGRQHARFAALRKSMQSRAPRQLSTYEVLLAAFRGFHNQQLDYFTRSCSGGNGCPVFSAMDEVHNNRDFLVVAQMLDEGGLPADSPLEWNAADDSLNKTYQAVLKANACPEVMIGPAHPCDADLRVVERAWLRYREAWVAAAAVLWPQADADGLRTVLTRQRTLELSL